MPPSPSLPSMRYSPISTPGPSSMHESRRVLVAPSPTGVGRGGRNRISRQICRLEFAGLNGGRLAHVVGRHRDSMVPQKRVRRRRRRADNRQAPTFRLSRSRSRASLLVVPLRSVLTPRRQSVERRHRVGDHMEWLLVDREDRHLRRAEQRRIVERSDFDHAGPAAPAAASSGACRIRAELAGHRVRQILALERLRRAFVYLKPSPASP